MDKPLTTEEKTYVQSLSSRVELTSTQAVFVYNYGDFRGKPKELLEKCFDVMLYMANWGSRQLMFRLPISLVDTTVLEPYCLSRTISISTTRNFVIIDINICDEEISAWAEGGGWLSSLVSLRDDLLRGDLRSLYLAWLKAAPMESDEDEEEEDILEPPVPPNLQDLSASLKTFVEFFEIDQDLIAAAAKNSDFAEEEDEDLEDLIPSLSESERNDFLVRLVRGESHLGVQLIHRLRELSNKQEKNVDNYTPRRTLSELLKLVSEETEHRQQQEQKAASLKKIEKLEALAKKETQVWEEVFKLIELKQSKPYDQAIAYLVQLRDLAEYQGKLAEFKSSIQQMKKDYSNRPGLISRLQKVGL
nr:hypothetical protein [Iningainema tapete]